MGLENPGKATADSGFLISQAPPGRRQASGWEAQQSKGEAPGTDSSSPVTLVCDQLGAADAQDPSRWDQALGLSVGLHSHP